MGMLEDIIANVNNFIGNTAADKGKVAELSADRQRTIDSNQDLYKIIGDSSSIVENTKNLATMQAQLASAKAASVLGTDYSKQSEVLTGLAAQRAEAYTKQQEALGKVSELSKVGLLDNPLQYVLNQFGIQAAQDQADVAGAQLTAAQRMYDGLNTSTQLAATTQASIAPAITASSAKAAADKVAAQATLEANKAKLEGLTYGVQDIKTIQGMSLEQLNSMMSLYSTERQAQAANLSAEHLRIAQMQLKMQLEKFQEEKDQTAFVTDMVNKGATNRLQGAYVPIDPGSLQAKNLIRLMNSDTPEGKALRTDFSNGMMSSAVPGNPRVLGANVPQVAETLTNLPVNLTPAQERVKSLYEKAAQDLPQILAKQGIDPKDRVKVGQVMSQLVSDYADTAFKKVIPGDASNPYNIPALSEVIAAKPELAQLPVVQKVLAPQLQAGNRLSEPNQVFQLALQAEQRGDISHKEFLQLGSLYQTGAAFNLATTQLGSFAIKPQRGYNVELTLNPNVPFGGKRVVDLTKPDDLERAYAVAKSAAMTQAFRSNEPFTTYGKSLTEQESQGFPTFLPKDK